MEIVRQILESKGTDVWTIKPESTIYDALKLMAEKGVGALLVMEGESVKGIFSERDYARKVVLKGKTSRETLVHEAMSSNVIYVGPAMGIEECMALMIDKRIRHLPVLNEGKLVGLISIGDVVKAVIGEKKFMIEQLIHYITGNR
ncbi:MAG: CBS domain-containing protein [Ignavibacteriales bacterium]|nr:MAG: CBS domain-containing protein [Ignavibacteriales bacterium]